MIEYIKGDLLTTDAPIIVHGCNAQGVMGSGVAKAIKEKYPKAYDDYMNVCNDYNHKKYPDATNKLLGRIIPSVQPDEKVIVNAITQESYRRLDIDLSARFVSYDAVDRCMERIANDLMFKDILGRVKKEPTTIAMPKIGAGLGGGQWSVIAAIIDYRLADHNVLVYHLE